MCEKNGSSSSDSDIIEVIDITGCIFFFLIQKVSCMHGCGLKRGQCEEHVWMFISLKI